MSFLFELDDERWQQQLPELIEKYEKEIAQAEPLFDLDGKRLELIARSLPYNQTHYDQLAQEAKQLVKWLENYRARIEARLTKNYLQGQRVYGARETATLIAGEKDMVEMNQLIIEATLVQQKLDAIVEGFKQMGWMVGNIVKLRVSQLEQVVL